MRLGFLIFAGAAMLSTVSSVAHAAPPTQEAIVKACDEADSAAQCEKVLEKVQLAQFPGIGTRDGPALRLATKPGMPAVELRDTGNPDDESRDYKWHA